MNSISKHIENQVINLEYDAFLRSIKQNIDVPISMFLGAGASFSSGIKTANDCIWDWKREIFLSKTQYKSAAFKDINSTTVQRKIQDWLDDQSEYPILGEEIEYSFYAELTYPIEEDRRKYFQSLCEGKTPYVGYQILAAIVELGVIRSVWTTNFDGLALKAVNMTDLTPLDITLDTADRLLRTSGKNEFSYIALHGDFKYGKLKNTASELDSQNQRFSEVLTHTCFQNHTIVLGYSGRDLSVMNTLKEAFSKPGGGHLYWCGFGAEIPSTVAELIAHARSNGREAFYISTEGFDKTMLHISKAFGDNELELLSKVAPMSEQLEKDAEWNPNVFNLPSNNTGKWLKTNLHPIVFPKELFQIELKFFKDESPWGTLRELTKNKKVYAVPFKDRVYCIGTSSEIQTIFGARLKGRIERTPISIKDIENVGAFKSLFKQCILDLLASSEGLKSNGRDRIWDTRKSSIVNLPNKQMTIYPGVFMSFVFGKRDSTHAFLSLKPTYEAADSQQLNKDERLKLNQEFHDKMFNKIYDDYLEDWRGRLFHGKKLDQEVPLGSTSGFRFQVSHKVGFAEIEVVDKAFRSYKPENYNTKTTIFTGQQLLEPQLLFENINTGKIFRDLHPMRALSNHKPYDFKLNNVLFSQKVDVSVICPSDLEQKVLAFLEAINTKKTASVNPDYLIDYPGFSNIFKIPINIPNPKEEGRWKSISIDLTAEAKTISLSIARSITDRIDKIASNSDSSIITIFIPTKWDDFTKYSVKGESFDLHDYIKAHSASKGISTQLIREKTLSDDLMAQKYWWLALSFYVKSFRTPWVLDLKNKETAYAGIGYSVNKLHDNSEVVIGCSHIYDSNGQGLKYRLSKVDKFVLDKRNNPFMSYEDSFKFGVSILELFYKSMDQLPERVVVHKRTHFKKDEIRGITESLKRAGIKEIDLIEINIEKDTSCLANRVNYGQMELDKFPVSRGTCIVTSENRALLWTHGIVPSVKNPKFKYFQGGRSIPAPLSVVRHYGESSLTDIATEILGLTKMNWNSFDLYTKLPATISSSNQIARVGSLLSRYEGQTYDYRLFI